MSVYFLANCTPQEPTDSGTRSFKGSGEILMCLPLVSILIHFPDWVQVTWGFTVYRKLWEWPPTMTSTSGAAAATSRSTSRPPWESAMIMSTPCSFSFAASLFTVSVSSRNTNFSVLDISCSTSKLLMTSVYKVKHICKSCNELNHDTWLVNKFFENLKIGYSSKNWI